MRADWPPLFGRAMARITLHDVTKSYGDGSVAVRGVSLDIADHEFVVLVGPSGCGKSTSLRMIAGLEDVTGGTISIASADNVISGLGSSAEIGIALTNLGTMFNGFPGVGIGNTQDTVDVAGANGTGRYDRHSSIQRPGGARTGAPCLSR